MKPIRFHSTARIELDEAMAFYESRAKGLGLDLQTAVEMAVARIKQAPQSWPTHGRSGFRKMFVDRFPYTVFYFEFDECVWIAAIAHGKRRPGYWQERRPEFTQKIPRR